MCQIGIRSVFRDTISGRLGRPLFRRLLLPWQMRLLMFKRQPTPGLRVDEFAPQLSFFFNAHNNFLEEVAKYRAARRLWAEIMRDRFHASDPRSMMLRFHAQTAGSTLTAQQPENNIVRVTLASSGGSDGGDAKLAHKQYG